MFARSITFALLVSQGQVRGVLKVAAWSVKEKLIFMAAGDS